MTLPSAAANLADQQRFYETLGLTTARIDRKKLLRLQEFKRVLRRLMPNVLYILHKCFRDFRLGHGGYPNVFRPRSFSEKIQYRKLFDRRPIFVQFTDKYAVRDYVRDRLGADCLTKLYHVTEDPADIPLDILPNRFVVKPTHGCGWISIVRDKTQLDLASLKRTCADWMNQNYFYRSGEWVYKHIKPRILFEELLDNGHGEVPYDYKFFVFDGRVHFVTVDIDRFGDHRRNSYDRDWNILRFGFQRGCSDRQLPRPARLDDMIRYAEILGSGFDFLRIDLYCPGNRIVFGEITTTPASGLEPFWPGGIDCQIGRLWHIDLKGRRSLA
jgi:hypothetical protein